MGLFNRKGSKGGDIDPNSQSWNPRSPTTKSPEGLVSFSSLPGPEPNLPPPPDPTLDAPAYLRSIYAVRQRARYVVVNCKRNQMQHFDVDLSKWKEVVGYVTSIIKVRMRSGPGNVQSLTRWKARLCTGLLENSPAWSMAAFRGRRSPTSRSALSVMAPSPR